MLIMPNVFVEPRPKAHSEGDPVTHYVLELAGSREVGAAAYDTQGEAIAAAKVLGLTPLIARVRVTDQGNPDHWRALRQVLAGR
jgi:hypothetical protein